MEVCNSSPVRSRKPVLINTTRSLAALMHSFKFSVVLRSSSIMPTLIVLRDSLSASSILANRSQVNCTSSGPCILGFTIFTEPLRLLLRPLLLPLRSCIAASTVIMPSSIPSGTWLPFLSNTASMVIK